MILFKVKGDISESLPNMVSDCLRFLGRNITSQTVEDCILKNNFTGLEYADVVDISCYASAINFIQSCYNGKYRTMSGILALSIANFLNRSMCADNTYIKNDVNPDFIAGRLDEVFLQLRKSDFDEFLKLLGKELIAFDFLERDSFAFAYLMVNFYSYTFYKRLLLLNDNTIIESDTKSSGQQQFLDWLSNNDLKVS